MFAKFLPVRVLEKSQSGQSLIEVTFAVSVVGLVLVAVLSLVIASLQQARRALDQTQATQYGQTTLEWIRAQRDQAGWGTFASALAAEGENPLVYCWAELPNSFDDLTAATPGECSLDFGEDVILNTMIKRQVEFEFIGTPITQISVTVILTRPGQDGPIENRIQTLFTDWE
jgi:type II secretory pathway pseudopilin PulG